MIIESDSQVITSRLSKAYFFYSNLDDAILGDVITLCSDFNSFSFSHVKRDGNSAVYHLIS